jgi:hypothetical protein
MIILQGTIFRIGNGNMPEKAHTSFRPDKHSTSHLHSLQSSGYTDYPENLLQPSSTNALESANNPPRNSEAPLHEHTHYFNSRYHVGSDVSTSEGLIAESSGYFDDSGGNNFPSLINERSVRCRTIISAFPENKFPLSLSLAFES